MTANWGRLCLPRVWSGLLCSHIHHTSDAVAGVHVVEGFIDLVEGLTVGDEFFDLQLAIHVVLDESWQLGTALDTSESAASPGPLPITPCQYLRDR